MDNTDSEKGVSVSKEQNKKIADPPAQPIGTQIFAEDEIDLIDYFLVLFKHKRFILLGCVIPTLLAGLILYLLPKTYTTSYTYSMAMGETELKILEEKFYSTENTAQLVRDLRERGLHKYGRVLAAAQTEDNIKQLAAFEVLPSLFDTKAKNFEELRERRDTQSSLLIMRLQNSSQKGLMEIASVIRGNFEQILPLYSEKERLTGRIIATKKEMAQIEETRFSLNLQLKKLTFTLEKLKNSMPSGEGKATGDVVLQFDISGDGGAYLPLPYQIQAVRTQQINLEEDIRTNTEKYDYYAEVLTLNETLLNHLNTSLKDRYSIEQFHAFLIDMLNQNVSKTPHLQDYLAAYIKHIENKMAISVPVIEYPIILVLSKGIGTKTGLVFIVAILLSIFGAFLREGIQRRKLIKPMS
jgi:hypothetical protein